MLPPNASRSSSSSSSSCTTTWRIAQALKERKMHLKSSSSSPRWKGGKEKYHLSVHTNSTTSQQASKHIKCRKQEESETEATAVITRTVHFRKYSSSNVLFYPSTTNQREPLWLLLLCDTRGVKVSSRVSVSLQRDGFHLPPCTLRGVRARL